MQKNVSENKVEDNNTINNYLSQHEKNDDKKEKSLFSARFAILQKLLNDARYYDEKEYWQLTP